MAKLTQLKRKRGEAFQLGYTDPNTGRYVRETLWCTRSEANVIKKKLESDLALAKFGLKSQVLQKRYKWSNLAKRYLAYAATEKAKGTVKRDRDVIKAFTDFLGEGDPFLKDMSSKLVIHYREHRLDKGLSPNTVALEIRHLKAMFNKGVAWEMIMTNPVLGVRQPRKEGETVRYLTQDEIERVRYTIQAAGHHDFLDLIEVYLHTGARRAELLPPLLTWDMVDFTGEGKIRILGKGSKRRFVPMNKTVRSILTRRFHAGEEVPFNFKKDYVTHRMAGYFREAGIMGANLHTLRKTFGSTLLQQGEADIYTVSKLLGHKNVSTTEAYYVDLIDENYRAPVASLDTHIGTRRRD